MNGETRYLVAKALERHQSLTNEQLDRRMRRIPLAQGAQVAEQFVPGARTVADIWRGERNFRVRRGAERDEARQIQRKGQQASIGAVASAGGLALASRPLKDQIMLRTLRGGHPSGKPTLRNTIRRLGRNKRLASGLALTTAGGIYGGQAARERKRTEDLVWRRLVREQPAERGAR